MDQVPCQIKGAKQKRGRRKRGKKKKRKKKEKKERGKAGYVEDKNKACALYRSAGLCQKTDFIHPVPLSLADLCASKKGKKGGKEGGKGKRRGGGGKEGSKAMGTWSQPAIMFSPTTLIRLLKCHGALERRERRKEGKGKKVQC